MVSLRDEKVLKRFGKYVKQLREEAGLTQAELANDMDVEISQISRIERGKVNTSLCTLIVLAKTLELPPSKLLDIDF